MEWNVRGGMNETWGRSVQNIHCRTLQWNLGINKSDIFYQLRDYKFFKDHFISVVKTGFGNVKCRGIWNSSNIKSYSACFLLGLAVTDDIVIFMQRGTRSIYVCVCMKERGQSHEYSDIRWPGSCPRLEADCSRIEAHASHRWTNPLWH